ncbi:hypothetical protein DS901_03930 [Loktanella sp. D2R18]|uniref:DUF4174 domain-containing protein n=1 Tax=Rhodobacterales TaxID=204455 RepID=UPI000DEB49A6|nr:MULTISPECIES: DUF4174 domain-containing protein [Rhodobacterales]MDO6589194.1 DUF4174 domain-containing protein [Yoonia sp. 1_MG-2023]RBW45380.1 hypothetical protein DS901_03930 [Loktanella sp. D2R18]
MKLLTNIGLCALFIVFGVATSAQEQTVLERWEADRTAIFDASDITLDDFQWLARPLIVFADSPNDPHFRQQMDLLALGLDDLAERDVIIITDTDPDAQTSVRLALRPRGYSMVLLGKDGRVSFRKPSAWNVREISRTIDKMPLRQQEVEDRRRISAQ